MEQSINGAAFSVIATLGAGSQSYTTAPMKRGKAYRFRVVAYNAAGASAYSNVASLTLAK